MRDIGKVYLIYEYGEVAGLANLFKCKAIEQIGHLIMCIVFEHRQD